MSAWHQSTGTGFVPTGRTTYFLIYPVQRGSPELWATYILLRGEILPPKVDPRETDPIPALHQTVTIFCEHHDVDFII